MTDLIGRLKDLTVNALGMGSPEDQIVSGLVLGVLIIATSSIGLVGTAILSPLAFAMVLVGFLRMIPQVDSIYPLSG